MEKLEYILSIAGTIISLLVACLTFALKLAKAVKENKDLFSREQLLKILPTFMEEAEHFTALSGEEKKQYVIDSIKTFAEKNKIPFDVEAISQNIEELVALSKQLNITTKTLQKQKSKNKETQK